MNRTILFNLLAGLLAVAPTSPDGPATVATRSFSGHSQRSDRIASIVAQRKPSGQTTPGAIRAHTAMPTGLVNGGVPFLVAPEYEAGLEAQTVAIGDFNGDGKLDVAVANYAGNDVSILLGNSDGTFDPAVNYSVGQNPTSIAINDFNGDGKIDLAVTNAGSNTVTVLLGNGDGTF
jgi:hypothetical protein